MSKLKLSILDLAKFTEETKTASEVLNQSTEIAKLADKLGYTRYWFAEHHNTSMVMSMFPEIMVAHVASQTQRIRVGTGGVML
ncbi:MAG TPA: LLM class flavin-dependent oxidoreductase, partial [Porphyromonadaceae bacterium]|nr:LLM class flavin-dependent oxidoreductase [Porphyromonadaceae bacterium]